VPTLGIAIVPVEKVGIGLTPGDAISVAPSGIPVGETGEPVAMPRGEVAPMVGVGVAVAPTCAIATLLTKSAGRTAAINDSFVGIPRFAAVSLGVGLSDIGLSPNGGKRSFVIICSCGDVQCSVSYAAACSKYFEHVPCPQGGWLVRSVQLNTILSFWCRFNRAGGAPNNPRKLKIILLEKVAYVLECQRHTDDDENGKHFPAKISPRSLRYCRDF
jgi:hypothetical protein